MTSLNMLQYELHGSKALQYKCWKRSELCKQHLYVCYRLCSGSADVGSSNVACDGNDKVAIITCSWCECSHCVLNNFCGMKKLDKTLYITVKPIKHCT